MFALANDVDPDEMILIMRHFTWVFTVGHDAHLWATTLHVEMVSSISSSLTN